MTSPAAWHPDPTGTHDHRYWDGERWTEHVADAGVAAIDPLPTGPTGTEGDDASHDTTTEMGSQPSTGSEPSPDATQDLGATPAAGSPPWNASGDTSGDTSGARPAWGGHPPAAQPGWGTTGAAPPSGMATTALVLGIVSLPLLLLFGFGVLLGIVAVVLGIIAVRRDSRGEASGRGMAIGGIVMGALSIVIGTVLGIFFFSFGLGIVEEFDACMQETGSRTECEQRLERDLTDRFLDG